MSTIRKVIERIDTNKPNAFTTENKVAWLAELDGKIAMDVFLMDVTEIPQFNYDPALDMDADLLVNFPHDDIYYYWLSAKIDAENGEYDKYQNTMQLYNACYNNFVTWFLDTYDPVQGCSGHFARRHNKPSYYITAYGLAVKRGFVGTIDEWLASLVGKSAYAHAVDGGYTGTQDDFVRKMAEDFRTYYVTMTTADGVTTADKTFEQLREKHLDGFHIRCKYPYSGTFVELDAVLVGDSSILFSGMRENVAYSIQMHADGSVAFAADLLARSAAIGQVSGLATADKTSLVAAINEVAGIAKKASKSGLVCKVTFDLLYPVGVVVSRPVSELSRVPDPGDIFATLCAGRYYTVFKVTTVGGDTYAASVIHSAEISTNVDLSGYVQSINGVGPDENGNVEITIPDSSQNAALTTAQIEALHGMFKVCAYDDSKDVSGAYAAFLTAFGITDTEDGGGDSGGSGEDSGGDSGETEVTLSSISATYSGGDVAVGTAVTALTGIVVKAHYSDGSSSTVTGYTLSGTIAEGSNTVTVSYGGKTTTFTVTGLAEESGEDAIVNMGNMVSIGSNGGFAYSGADTSDKILTSQAGHGWTSVEPFAEDTNVHVVFEIGAQTYANFAVGSSLTPASVPMSVYYAVKAGDATWATDKTYEIDCTVKAGHYLAILSSHSAVNVTVTVTEGWSDGGNDDSGGNETPDGEPTLVAAGNVITVTNLYSDAGETAFADKPTIASVRQWYVDAPFDADTEVTIAVLYGSTNTNLKQYACCVSSLDSADGYYAETIGSAQTTEYTYKYTVRAGHYLRILNFNAGTPESITVTK